jgi:GAF domain-containing protein
MAMPATRNANVTVLPSSTGVTAAPARVSATRVRAAAEASRLFVEAGRSRVALCRALARSLARAPGDACVIHTFGREGRSLRAVAVAHADPGAHRLLRQLLRAAPNALLDAFSLRALQGGQPVRVPVIAPELLSLWTQPEFGAYAERFIASSIFVVPLRARGHRLGVLRAWRERPHGIFPPDAEEFILELVERLALA